MFQISEQAICKLRAKWACVSREFVKNVENTLAVYHYSVSTFLVNNVKYNTWLSMQRSFYNVFSTFLSHAVPDQECGNTVVICSCFLMNSLKIHTNLLRALGCVHSFMKLKQQSPGLYGNSLFTVIYTTRLSIHERLPHNFWHEKEFVK